MSAKRSNGTIMSRGGLVDARVDEAPGVADAAVDAGRRASRSASICCVRRTSPGHRDLRAIEGAVTLEQPPAESCRSACRAPSVSAAGDLVERPGAAVVLAGKLELDEQQQRGVRRERDRLVHAVDAVFVAGLEAAAVEMLDRGDVDAARDRAAAHVCREAVPQLVDERQARRFGRSSAPGPARSNRASGQDPQRGVDDDAERALGADEQIDQIHVGRREISGRTLGHVRHHVRARPELPLPVRAHRIANPRSRIRAHVAALDVEHMAARQARP